MVHALIPGANRLKPMGERRAAALLHPQMPAAVQSRCMVPGAEKDDGSLFRSGRLLSAPQQFDLRRVDVAAAIAEGLHVHSR